MRTQNTNIMSKIPIFAIVCVYLYILREFRKLVIISKNVKNNLNLITQSLFLKIKNRVRIVIQ